ncbi:ABC transporter substrate-binding protein [Brevibacterium aurantiacum]|uniref:ABC transporter substrate-binding protein n=1 Tax=Brevibacterium aurantiacum TaxID=273384 RepID=UPI0018695DBB|nr:ABC transporter substrate-binding protein [Brevibacterium aurantiacum]
MRRRQLLALSVLAPFALAACGSPVSEAASTTTTGTNGFSYSPEGYDGLTIELDHQVERVAMDFYSAAALAPYGIKPVAVYGFGQNESPGKAFDQTGVEIVGTDMEFNLEALAATNPDIIIAYGNDKGDGWTWWDDKLKDQVAKLVPFVPVKLDGGTPDDMFAQYAAIAQALGRDTETGKIAQQRKAFGAARQRIRDITAEKDWLTVLLANFGAEINYTAKKVGVAKMLTDDGLTLVGPESGAETSWAEVSWEKMSDYPADVMLIHDASTDYEDNPIFKSLLPVRHNQLGTWDDKRAYTYDGYTEWLGELADVLEEAKDINKD